MIFNWTFFIVSVILASGSLICSIGNIIEYVNGGKGEYRVLYIIATVMFTLFAAAVADSIFK